MLPMPSKNRLREILGDFGSTLEREWLNSSFSILKLGLSETPFLYF